PACPRPASSPRTSIRCATRAALTRAPSRPPGCRSASPGPAGTPTRRGPWATRRSPGRRDAPSGPRRAGAASRRPGAGPMWAGGRPRARLVARHAPGPVAAGLGGRVRTPGCVERQLRRWHAQVHATDPPETPLLDEVHDLLARRIPAQAGGIVHGDYRAGNVAFGPDGAIRAVFDWELATSGDPMADLGWLASTWQ